MIIPFRDEHSGQSDQWNRQFKTHDQLSSKKSSAFFGVQYRKVYSTVSHLLPDVQNQNERRKHRSVVYFCGRKNVKRADMLMIGFVTIELGESAANFANVKNACIVYLQSHSNFRAAVVFSSSGHNLSTYHITKKKQSSLSRPQIIQLEQSTKSIKAFSTRRALYKYTIIRGGRGWTVRDVSVVWTAAKCGMCNYMYVFSVMRALLPGPESQRWQSMGHFLAAERPFDEDIMRRVDAR